MPLKPSEAAALAQLIYARCENGELTPQVRSQLKADWGVLGLANFQPQFDSLQRDSSGRFVYYVMADVAETYLLRIAVSSAPAVPPFEDPILIGRLRPAGERELLVQAIHFSIEDQGAIYAFAANVDSAILPLPSAAAEAPRVPIADPLKDFPAAFSALAPSSAPPVFVTSSMGPEVGAAAVWSAIRSGWRSGYSLETDAAIK